MLKIAANDQQHISRSLHIRYRDRMISCGMLMLKAALPRLAAVYLVSQADF
jgi:hypothetical protein